ncbi:uncharacterized protein LOC131048297 [Cryptomeria japonica]|uniref:uncharacterized protein LOC131048297 n=1 Tax=Cryptomeria japonica TaxID=3369 RepID=UPI0027DA8760|nr:uncharacterized protein LOC131048297 [Cryptomeria japonica]
MSCMAMQTISEGKDMEIEEFKINARGTRLWNVLRFAVMMLRKGIAAKKLQKMAVDLHMAISRGIKFGGLDKYVSNGGSYMNNNKKSLGFMDYEFSCSSTPMVKRRANLLSYSGPKKHGGRWDQRFLMATMPCIAKEAESVINSTIPKFIQCGEDFFDPSRRTSSTPSYLSTRSELSEIDRQAEEFIASFYNEMKLQRQDSFSKYREMLDRGSG